MTVRLAWCVLALLAAPAGAYGQQPSRLVMRLERLNDRVAVISGFANGNILVVLGENGTLLVDAQSARRVGLADSALRTLTDLPVRWLVNTHYHDDHTQGNAWWRERGARVLAHANVPLQAAKDTVIAEMDNWHREPLPAAARPDSTFTDSVEIRLGAETVRVIHVAPAHTDGDAIVWLPRSDIMHSGDLVETEAFPFIDWWAGGSLDGMVAAIDLLSARVGERTRIVPGHGPVVDRSFLAAQRAMLVTMGARVRAAIDSGRTLEQVLAANPATEFVPRFGSERSAAHFIKGLYLGLSRSRQASR